MSEPTDRSERAQLQTDGRALLTALYGALRALKLYPLENETVQSAIDELHALMTRVAEEEAAVELRVVGDFFFLNETRLRLGLNTFSTYGSFARSLSDLGVGSVEVLRGVRREEWAPFLSLLVREPTTEDPYSEFLGRLAQTPVENIHVSPEQDTGIELDEEESLQAAKRTYAQSVKVAKDMLTDVRMGRAVNVRKVKRAVQGIVDQVLSNEPSMITMTTLRDFDEYTFTHCVNVSIFSVVIGQQLGFTKLQLYDLGLAGLLHDIGKMRVAPEIINKTENLSDSEWRALKEHPTEGLLLLFHMAGFTEMPFRQMLVAYEHHMKIDFSGYPENDRSRELSLFSRIVAVADGFDAGTSVRSYQYEPWPPDRVLRAMRDESKRGFDGLLVKALINSTGVFPIGTLVILDTLELAVVSGVNRDPKLLHLPKIKVISDEMGVPVAEPYTLDLAEPDPETGRPVRRIIKTTDAQRYGIRVSDYLT